MAFNPFIELARYPIVTLAYLAYGLLLLGATIKLVGVAQDHTLWLKLAFERKHTDTTEFGPKWDYAPPPEVYNKAAWLALTLAVEAFLIATLVWLATTEWPPGLV